MIDTKSHQQKVTFTQTIIAKYNLSNKIDEGKELDFVIKGNELVFNCWAELHSEKIYFAEPYMMTDSSNDGTITNIEAILKQIDKLILK